MRLKATICDDDREFACIEEYRAAGEKLNEVKHEIGRVVEMTKLMLEKCQYDKVRQYLSEFYAISDAIKRKTSTKADGKNHGYGLLNIYDILKKCGGSIEYEMLDIYVECKVTV